MSWQDYVVSERDRRSWEPKDPETWMKLDRLLPFMREFSRQKDFRKLEESVGWAFAAWTRLPYEFRLSSVFERAVVAALLEERTFRRIDHFFAAGIQGNFPFVSGFPRTLPFGGHATINVTAPMASEFVGEIRVDLADLPEELRSWTRIPVVIQYFPPPILFTQVAQPTQTSPGTVPSHSVASSDVIYGTSASGLLSPGLVTAFARDSTSSDPLLVGSAHVLGNVGSSVDAFGRKIGHVIKVDLALDAAVVELDAPWAVDYRVRTLGRIPAPPVLPANSMNIQFVDQHGVVQVGYIWQSILVGPGLATIGVAPHFTCSCQAQGGDSGGLIMTGHFGTSAWSHYAAVTAQANLDMYTCAMLGHVLGGAAGGAAGVPSQAIGIPIVEILTSLQLDPLHR
jgi:hypothetical protein